MQDNAGAQLHKSHICAGLGTTATSTLDVTLGQMCNSWNGTICERLTEQFAPKTRTLVGLNHNVLRMNELFLYLKDEFKYYYA